jgi:hypothetical protein
MGDADIVIGDRSRDYMNRPRRFGNWILSQAFNVGRKNKIPDAMTGFWSARTEALPDILIENEWGLEIEIFLKSIAAGSRVVNTPVMSIYHKSFKENSTSRPLPLGIKLLATILKWRLILKQ